MFTLVTLKKKEKKVILFKDWICSLYIFGSGFRDKVRTIHHAKLGSETGKGTKRATRNPPEKTFKVIEFLTFSVLTLHRIFRLFDFRVQSRQQTT